MDAVDSAHPGLLNLTEFHLYLIVPIKLRGNFYTKSTLVGPFSKNLIPHSLWKTLSERVREVTIWRSGSDLFSIPIRCSMNSSPHSCCPKIC